MDTRAIQLVPRAQLSSAPDHNAIYRNVGTFAPVRLYDHPLRVFSGNLNLIGETGFEPATTPPGPAREPPTSSALALTHESGS